MGEQLRVRHILCMESHGHASSRKNITSSAHVDDRGQCMTVVSAHSAKCATQPAPATRKRRRRMQGNGAVQGLDPNRTASAIAHVHATDQLPRLLNSDAGLHACYDVACARGIVAGVNTMCLTHRCSFGTQIWQSFPFCASTRSCIASVLLRPLTHTFTDRGAYIQIA
jgi:hypothetical protein